VVTFGILFFAGVSQTNAVSFEDPSGQLGLGTSDLKTSVLETVRLVLGLLGIIVIAMFLIAVAFNWEWSGASRPVKIWTSRALPALFIGLIIILLAWAIVSYILSTFEDVTN